MEQWIAAEAERIAAAAPEQLERLVDVSSPSGDLAGAEAAIAVVRTTAIAASAPARSPDGDETATSRSSCSGAASAIRCASAAIQSIPVFYLLAALRTVSGSRYRLAYVAGGSS